MSSTRKRFVPVIAALASFAIPAIASTPIPNVKGPLPVTSTSYPFGAAGHEQTPEDLKRIGYVEEEFLISGTANVYDWPTLRASRPFELPTHPIPPAF